MSAPAKPDQVLTAASRTMRSFVPWSFFLEAASEKADEAWEKQWRSYPHRSPPNGGWDWPSLRKSTAKDPSALLTAMWCGQDLCGLSLLTLNSTACKLSLIEGSPNPHHLIRGMVLLIGIELSSMWAQGSGRREVWVMGPMSDMILHHLLQDYSFDVMAPAKGLPFCRRAC
jgi:hypothetical protein